MLGTWGFEVDHRTMDGNLEAIANEKVRAIIAM